jgi:hypothetical protein
MRRLEVVQLEELRGSDASRRLGHFSQDLATFATRADELTARFDAGRRFKSCRGMAIAKGEPANRGVSV